MGKTMDFDCQNLDSTDVVYFAGSKGPFHATIRVQEVYDYVTRYNLKHLVEDEGAEVEILRPGQTWQRGKLRLRLEFVPDQPESSLDDIRELNHQSNGQLAHE
jgi:hypothetical protein